MSSSSRFPFARRNRNNTKGHGSRRRPAPALNLEPLEDRCLLSRNIISGYVFNDVNNSGLWDATRQGIVSVPVELRNASGVVIATALTGANGYYEFTKDNSIDTRPTGLTRTLQIANTATDWLRQISAQKFDPSLGTLISVEVVNAGAITSRIKFESLDSAPSRITGTVSGTLTLTGPGLDPLVMNTAENEYFDATAFDGILDFAGTSGHDFGDKTANGSSSFTITSSTVLSLYVGSGSVTLTEIAHATSSVSGAGNLVSQIATNARADVSVIYHYIPSDALRPGTYTIVEARQPNGYLDGKLSRNGVVIANSVGSHSIQVTLGDADLPHNDFAHLVPSSLAGFVYMDANNNGIRDASKPPLVGVNVTLTGSDDLGNVNQAFATIADGSYQFRNLRPGTYTIVETEPAGYLRGRNAVGSAGGVAAADRISAINLGTGTNGSNYNFAELLPSALSGFVYVDMNNSGVRVSGDPVLGVAIRLTGRNDWGTVDVVATTATDGSYQFRNLRPGLYTVSETEPAGYLRGRNAIGSLGGTLGAADLSQITVAVGVNGIDYNFAHLVPASLSGFVYVDANNNGVHDPGAVGIGGVTIRVVGRNDLGPIDVSTTTAGDGSYRIRNLRPGIYTISEAEPAGYLRGKNSLGSLGGTVGTADVSSITVAVGANGTDYNFAHLVAASVAGFVYVDSNNNGTKDPGEPGLGGVTLTLTGANDLGAVNLTTRTAADGSYVFGTLRPGTYTVVETEPAAYLRGKNAVGSAGGTAGGDRISGIALTVGSAATNYNFAELTPASLAGFVYVDINENGVKDPGEPGLAGVTITLTGSNDLGTNLNISQTTGGDGSYQFAGLRPGNYVITVSQPANYIPGKNSLGSAGGTIGANQFSDIGLGVGVAGNNYNFAELTPNPTGLIFADSFGPNESIFMRPQDLSILTKLQLLSSNGQLDLNLATQGVYVDGLYRTILGRGADVSGLIGWVQQLQSGVSRLQVVAAIWSSAEHRGLQIDRYYATFLHRAADAAGRAGWVNIMLGGASELEVARAILSSGEYQASHADAAAYVTGLYADILGRRPGAAEVSGWVQAMQNGVPRAVVAMAFLTSNESYQLILNCDYRHFLQRPPDVFGNQAWLAALSSGQATPALVCQVFLASDEFYARARRAATSA